MLDVAFPTALFYMAALLPRLGPGAVGLLSGDAEGRLGGLSLPALLGYLWALRQFP